ncbi:sugar phosphate isomerase/epimerase family protein [Shewanella fidelis]|uniref:TIM barrel protein n=1 Tax=Shewanella fidelis TaxID=173509 RepID=A0AAW8NNE5_9GAMM|nr:TIM barrel protein [Shewanella fidelis]MDR8524422.1 TIM barrel protein [Shewanella fidelis]MDW4811898.1 TIM barrel protein [Shewanella fidelis]MDW4817163.1 TIM barrel protein [Shewanella fidelis]MDW4821233.1 TIM barrel protein [Shewanella fidelis]MDW4822504.1 TIM barrel protein [Shewanella fidelis]
MRLGVSNLIASSISASQLNELYSLSDCIDWAPTVTAPHWNLLTESGAAAFGLTTKISAIQSLFYGINDVHFMQEEEKFLAFKNHIAYLINVSKAYSAKYILWGSPGTRNSASALIDDKALFKRLTQILSLFDNEDVKFMIEAVSPKFGCEFINNSIDLLSLHEQINHNNFSLHLDTGQMIEEGLDVLKVIENNVDCLNHLHLSEPDFNYTGSYASLFKEIVSIVENKDIDVVYEVQTLKSNMYDKFINEFSGVRSI